MTEPVEHDAAAWETDDGWVAECSCGWTGDEHRTDDYPDLVIDGEDPSEAAYEDATEDAANHERTPA